MSVDVEWRRHEHDEWQTKLGRKEGRMERKGVTLETAEPDTTGYAVTGGPLPRLREIGFGGDDERSSFVGKILGVFLPLAV